MDRNEQRNKSQANYNELSKMLSQGLNQGARDGESANELVRPTESAEKRIEAEKLAKVWADRAADYMLMTHDAFNEVILEYRDTMISAFTSVFMLSKEDMAKLAGIVFAEGDKVRIPVKDYKGVVLREDEKWLQQKTVLAMGDDTAVLSHGVTGGDGVCVNLHDLVINNADKVVEKISDEADYTFDYDVYQNHEVVKKYVREKKVN